MPTACINQPNCRIHLHSERLEIFGKNPQSDRDELLREIPIRDLDRLIMTENVQISSPALGALLLAEIPIQILSATGEFLGGFLPAQNDHGLARLRQYTQTCNPEFGMKIVRKIISAKLYNQRRVLQRLNSNRSELPDQGASGNQVDIQFDNPVVAALAWLDGFFASVKTARTVDELRGYEGATTARYFQAWAGFLPPAFPFERRSTRPPLNPVNACISFGATIIYSEMASFIHAHGLDPALGLLHATEDRRWSLALDLMEVFRPILVEAMALDLFSHQILNRDHFEQKNGGVYLNSEGRKKFFLQYERRMERQFMSEAAGHRTSLRQQLEQQAVNFKSALENPENFEPFLMN